MLPHASHGLQTAAEVATSCLLDVRTLSVSAAVFLSSIPLPSSRSWMKFLVRRARELSWRLPEAWLLGEAAKWAFKGDLPLVPPRNPPQSRAASLDPCLTVVL